MALLLSLDQGTTSSRTLLFDGQGRKLAMAQREFPQSYPRPGWVEQDPDDIWQSQLETVKEVLASGASGDEPIAALGITNQRETTILWERATGKPLAPAIVWQDRRTASLCHDLRKQGYEELVQEKTGLLLDPYFSGTKIAWLLRENPDWRKRAERGELAFGTVDSWLVWKLTGGKVHQTDVSNASRTLLLNLNTLGWDDELLGLLDIPRELLPEVVDTAGRLATEISLPGATGTHTLGSMVGDQQAALFGQGCLEPGKAKNTYGTGCFLLWQLGPKPQPSAERLLTTVGWRFGKQLSYALEGSIFMGGAIVQWLRDGLKIIKTAPDVEALAREVDDSGGLILVPAFTGLGAPHWDPAARGLMIGMTRDTTHAHLARAALEAIAFQTAEVLEAMERDTGHQLSELRVDGGASANDLLLQIQADLLGVPVVRAPQSESTAWGAAALAGIGCGVWASPEEVHESVGEGERFLPELESDERRKRRKRYAAAVRRATGWASDEEGESVP